MKNKYLIAFALLFAFAISIEQVNATDNRTENFVYNSDLTNVSQDFDYVAPSNAPCSSLQVSGSVTAISCFGGNDGAITLMVSGGNAPYTYLWNDGSTMGSRTNLSRGVYDVTVTDDSSCVKTIRRWVNSPASIRLNSVVTPASCKGTMDGSIVTSVVGGTSPYTYLWNTGSTSSSITGIGRGVYTVTVTDGNSCTRVFKRWVNDPPKIRVTATSIVNATCYNTNDGQITISVVGGMAPYTYLWNDGSTDQNRTNASRGANTVVVTGSGTCTGSLTVWVSSPSKVRVLTVVNPASCFSSTNGTIIASGYGGKAPYTYLWSNGTTTAVNNGIGRGAYTVTVTDASGCTGTTVRWVNSPLRIKIQFNVTQPSSSQANDGSVAATVTGGTPPYQYIWSNAQTTSTATGLSTGSVTLIVIDANFCTNSRSVTLHFPEANTKANHALDIDVSVFPNPTSNNFTAQLRGTNAGQVEIQLIDISGRLVDAVFTNTGFGEYNFGDSLKPGVYFLRIVGNGYIKSVRLVKL